MGFWFNNYHGFEGKNNWVNRLVMNFYYVPEEGEEAKRVKVFVRKNVRIPSRFIFSRGAARENVDKVMAKILEDRVLRDFVPREKKAGNFTLLEVDVPYDRRLVKNLPGEFQKGSYDKLLRLGGLYPERRVEFSAGLEKKLLGWDLGSEGSWDAYGCL